MPDIAIVPAPRELTVDDARWITADPLAEAIRDVVENLGETEYRIEVTADGARLTAGSEDALRHAETTYAQLVEAAEPAGAEGRGGGAGPPGPVSGAPRVGGRGVMADAPPPLMPAGV